MRIWRLSIFRPTALPEPGAERPPALLRLVAHDRGVTAAALLAVTAIAWAWLLAMDSGDAADHGGMEMAMSVGAAPAWSASYLAAAFAMWALMMVAMMLPSAAPMILLYGRVARRAPSGGGQVAAFAAAYLAIWTSFAAAGAIAQAWLVSSDRVSEMALAIGDSRIAGALLLVAGLYELSPLKQSCLEACRSPLSFIMRLSRPGLSGALRLGTAHGLYCLGCCWALMLLLFVGGVMNLFWVLLVAAIVAVEKLAPAALRISRVLSALLIAGGALLILG